MRRRDFISVLGGVAATWPLAAHAQQPARMARLGYLAPASISHLIEALRGGLRDLGCVEGQNLAIEYRFALGQSKETLINLRIMAHCAFDSRATVWTGS